MSGAWQIASVECCGSCWEALDLVGGVARQFVVCEDGVVRGLVRRVGDPVFAHTAAQTVFGFNPCILNDNLIEHISEVPSRCFLFISSVQWNNMHFIQTVMFYSLGLMSQSRLS